MNAIYKKFSFSNRTFVTDASDLSGAGSPFHLIGGKQGITVIGRTGRTADYVVVGAIHSVGDVSDIAGWNLAPTPESEVRNPACRGTRVLIAND